MQCLCAGVAGAGVVLHRGLSITKLTTANADMSRTRNSRRVATEQFASGIRHDDVVAVQCVVDEDLARGEEAERRQTKYFGWPLPCAEPRIVICVSTP